MKMKAIVGLIAIGVILSGVMVGCKAEVYLDVSVGRMTVSIPDNGEWVEEALEAVNLPEWVTVVTYRHTSHNAYLTLTVYDLKRSMESEGFTWEGWKSELEAEGISKEDIIKQIEALLFSEFFSESFGAPKVHRQLTINGAEAFEEQYLGYIGDVRIWSARLNVIGENDVGGLMMMVSTPYKQWEFEETWGKIRDSVRLP